MALVLADRVQETTTSTGTGSVTLLGAVTGYQTFAVIGNGNTCYYTIADQGGSNWEVGIGTYTSSGTSLSRDTVLSSSNAGSLVDFTAGIKTVFVTYPSEKSVNLNASGNVSPLGTVSSGTWQGSTVGVAYGGTGVTSSSGANSVVLRDADQNISVNSVTQNLTKTVSAGGTTVLTLASSHFQVLTGTSAQTYQLPDATSLPTGSTWVFDNDSTQNLTVVDNASGTVDVVAPGGYATVFLEANGTVAGEWGRYGMIPSEVNWGTNSLDLGGSTVITNGVWQGTPVASGYGGTGLTTFSAANNALYSTSSSALTAGTLPVAAGGTGVTTSTGSGNVVLSNSPTLVTPALGTPSSGDLSNCTGYPAGSISGTVGIAQGGTGQTTASAAFNALSPVTSTGDLIVGNGTNSSTRLAIGTTGKVLTSNGTTVSWETPDYGGGTITTTDFTATSGQTVFTVNYTVGSTEVYQNGVKLGIADFTATNGTSITLATGATVGDLVEVVTFSVLNLYSTITYEDFSGTGSQTIFTMSAVPANSASLLVAISGVVQDPGTYTVSSTTLTFLTAPPSGSGNVSVRYLGVATTGSSFSAGTTGLTPASATTGAVTLGGTLNVANGGTGVTTSTGSGANVLGTSPTLTTPTIDKINTSVANTSLGAGNASIMKNRIINGAMVIDQRNAGASVTPTSGATYTLDRWTTVLTQSSKFSVQQNAGSVTPPVGFTNYLGVTSLSAYSVASGDAFAIRQSIEGYNIADMNFGSANAKTFTLSFWVRSSLTGTFGGSFNNTAPNRCYPFTYTISAANTWEQKSVTVVGDTSGTWATTTSTGISVIFGLGAGSTYSTTANSWATGEYYSATGATSVVGTSGATFYITGVQLEVGSSATGYEYRQYQQELALCQRYYQQDSSITLYGANVGSNTWRIPVYFKVTMRSSPFFSATQGGGGGTPVTEGASPSSITIGTNSSASAPYYSAYTANAEL